MALPATNKRATVIRFSIDKKREYCTFGTSIQLWSLRPGRVIQRPWPEMLCGRAPRFLPWVMLHLLCRSGINRNFIFQPYSWTIFLMQLLPSENEQIFWADRIRPSCPSIPFNNFHYNRRASAAKKYISKRLVIERNELSKKFPKNTKTKEFLQITCGFLYNRGNGAGLRLKHFRVKQDSKES